jgi:hypothetical protein
LDYSVTIEVYFDNTLVWSSFEGGMEYCYDVTVGRAAPSVASSLQKRGPRRPPRTGRRGRLPFLLANPRRDSVLLNVPSMHFANEILIPRILVSVERRGKWSTLAVVARGGFPIVAMVRLVMAMAMKEATGDLSTAELRPEELEIGSRRCKRREGNSFGVLANERYAARTILTTP